MEAHWMIQHGKAQADKWSWNEAATGGGEAQTYRIEFPTKGGTRECPVEGCPGRAGTRTAMRVHFWCRHVRDIVIILEEGTSHIQGAHDATFWSCGGPSMGDTRAPQCAGVGRRGRDGDWRIQRYGKTRRCPLRSTGDNSRRCQVLSTWGEY